MVYSDWWESAVHEQKDVQGNSRVSYKQRQFPRQAINFAIETRCLKTFVQEVIRRGSFYLRSARSPNELKRAISPCE